jgi:hypothetical protein
VQGLPQKERAKRKRQGWCQLLVGIGNDKSAPVFAFQLPEVPISHILRSNTWQNGVLLWLLVGSHETSFACNFADLRLAACESSY